MAKDFKSSRDYVESAITNLDPDKELIKGSRVEIDLLREQNNSLKNIKNTLGLEDPDEDQMQHSILTSLKSSVNYLSSMSGRLSSISSTTSAIQAVVSPIDRKFDTTISLLGSIKTGLTQITGVLSAFRADYLLAANGVTPKGDSYINKNLLTHSLQPLFQLNSKPLKASLAEMRKAGIYADLMANAVKGAIGNNNFTREDDGGGLISKLIGKLPADMQEYGELASQFLPILGMMNGKPIDDRNVKTLLSSIMSENKVRTIINPLNEMMGQWMNSAPNGKIFNVRQLLAGKINELTGFGDDTKQLQQERDPNLVLSALAPLADDIKDIVESEFEAIRQKPKFIPNYAKPVWVVNSEYQRNGLDIYGTNNLETNEKDLDLKRLIDLIEGTAVNKKDKYGRDLYNYDYMHNDVNGVAVDRFFDKYGKDENGNPLSYQDKYEWIAGQDYRHRSEMKQDITKARIITQDANGELQEDYRETLAGAINKSDLSGIDNVGSLAVPIIQALQGDYMGAGMMALMSGLPKMLLSKEDRDNFKNEIKGSARNTGNIFRQFSEENKAKDKKLNIATKFKYLLLTKLKSFLGYSENDKKIKKEDSEIIETLCDVITALKFSNLNTLLESLDQIKDNVISVVNSIAEKDTRFEGMGENIFNMMGQCALECWDFDLPQNKVDKLLSFLGNKITTGLENFGKEPGEGHSSGRSPKESSAMPELEMESISVPSSSADVETAKPKAKQSIGMDDLDLGVRTVNDEAVPTVVKDNEEIVPEAKVRQGDNIESLLLDMEAIQVANTAGIAELGMLSAQMTNIIAGGDIDKEPKITPLHEISKILSSSEAAKTTLGSKVLTSINKFELPDIEVAPEDQEHLKMKDLIGDKKKEDEKKKKKTEEEEEDNSLKSTIQEKFDEIVGEKKEEAVEKLKESTAVQAASDKINDIVKLDEKRKKFQTAVGDRVERTEDSLKNIAHEKANNILFGKDGNGGLKKFAKNRLVGKDGNGGLVGLGKKIALGKEGKGGLVGLGKKIALGKDGNGGLKGLVTKLTAEKEDKEPTTVIGKLAKKGKSGIKHIAVGKEGKGGIKGLVTKIAVGENGNKGLKGLVNKLDAFNEAHGGKTEAEKAEERRQQEKDNATEQALRNQQDALDHDNESRQNAQNEIDNQRVRAATESANAEVTAATEGVAQEASADAANAASETAAQEAANTAEVAAAGETAAIETGAATSESILEKVKGAAKRAIEMGSSVAGSGIKLIGSIGSGILKLVRGSKILKLAIGVGLGATLIGIIKKISKKTLKSASSGKPPTLDDVKLPSIKAPKGGKDEEEEKEKEATEKAESEAEANGNPQEVYIKPNGSIVDAETDEPVKYVTKKGKEKGNLNIFSKLDLLNLRKRIKHKELKLVKKPKKKPEDNVQDQQKEAEINNENNISTATVNDSTTSTEQINPLKYTPAGAALGAAKTIMNSLSNENVINAAKNGAGKMAKFAFMMANPVLFAGAKTLKTLKKLKDSPFGNLMSKNPTKASDILSNTGSTGAAMAISNGTTSADLSGSNTGEGFWTNLFDDIFGFKKEKYRAGMSTDLADASSENASIALAKSYITKAARNFTSKISENLGLAKIEDDTTDADVYAQEKTGSYRAHGKMSTSEIYDKERKRVYVQTSTGSGSSSADVDDGSGYGTLSTSIPYNEYGIWKQRSDRGNPHALVKDHEGETWSNIRVDALGGQDIGSAGCSLTSLAMLLVHAGQINDPDFNPGVLGNDCNERGVKGSCGAANCMRDIPKYKGEDLLTFVDTMYFEGQSFDKLFEAAVDSMKKGYFLLGHVTDHYVAIDYIDTANKVIYIFDPAPWKANCWYDGDNKPKILDKTDIGYTMDLTPIDSKKSRKIKGFYRYKAKNTSADCYLLSGRRTFDSLHPNGNAPGATIDPGAGSMSKASANGSAVKFFLDDMEGSSISSHIWRNDGSWHGGSDIAAAQGTPIHTPVEGTVWETSNETGYNNSMGNFVVLRDKKNNVWRMMHMVDKPLVKAGQKLKKGQQIGKVGNTGESYGAHLHVDISKPRDNYSWQPQGQMYDPEYFNLKSLSGKVPSKGESSYYMGKGKNNHPDGGSCCSMDDEEEQKKQQKSTASVQGTNGKGKDDHLYQRDFGMLPFNSNIDSVVQTLGDSGCGPAAAATVSNIYRTKKNNKKYKRRFGRAKNNEDSTKKKIEEVTESSADDEDTSSDDMEGLIGKTASSTDENGKTRSLTVTQDCIDIWNTLKKDGFADGAAAGVIGNLVQECGGGTLNIREVACRGQITYGGGIMQWTPYSQHTNWCAKHNYQNPESWEANLAHLVDEINNPSLGVDLCFKQRPTKYSNPPVAEAGFKVPSGPEEFKKDNDPENAAVIFERCYEMSGDWDLKTNEKVNYSGMQPRDINRREYAKIVFALMNGKGTIGSSDSTATIGGDGGLLEIKLDTYVDAIDAISKHITDPGVLFKEEKPAEETDENDNSSAQVDEAIIGDISGETSTAETEPTNTVNTSKNISDQKVIIGSTPTTATVEVKPKTVEAVVPDNVKKSSNTTVNNTFNNNRTSSATVNAPEDEKYTITSTNSNGIEKTTIRTNTGGTIVVCNNYENNVKNNLEEVIDNFKHLNNTQGKALKVLKAISDLIKDDPNSELGRGFTLNDDGLDLILKGL